MPDDYGQSKSMDKRLAALGKPVGEQTMPLHCEKCGKCHTAKYDCTRAMLTPDTLASLIAKMPHDRMINMGGGLTRYHRMTNDGQVFDERCTACKHQAALDALVKKWEAETWDKASNYGRARKDCASELRGRGASE